MLVWPRWVTVFDRLAPSQISFGFLRLNHPLPFTAKAMATVAMTMENVSPITSQNKDGGAHKSHLDRCGRFHISIRNGSCSPLLESTSGFCSALLWFIGRCGPVHVHSLQDFWRRQPTHMHLLLSLSKTVCPVYMSSSSQSMRFVSGIIPGFCFGRPSVVDSFRYSNSYIHQALVILQGTTIFTRPTAAAIPTSNFWWHDTH